MFYIYIFILFLFFDKNVIVDDQLLIVTIKTNNSFINTTRKIFNNKNTLFSWC